jgi:HSP20 family protein
VSITVEIPGVEKNDIDLSVVGQTLKIKVDSAERRYFKEVQLPAHVDPGSTKATYNNGVLDITLCKSGRGQEKKIRIE